MVELVPMTSGRRLATALPLVGPGACNWPVVVESRAGAGRVRVVDPVRVARLGLIPGGSPVIRLGVW
ncbi:MAG: hypothetical protein QOK10_1968 [Pseudonocardiales bacterium]|nr:hypothetical protein [Pseudonocardiales bacterium]